MQYSKLKMGETSSQGPESNKKGGFEWKTAATVFSLDNDLKIVQ